MGRGKFHRAVGLVIAVLASTGATLLWFAVIAGGPDMTDAPTHEAIVGVWSLLYNTDSPVRV